MDHLNLIKDLSDAFGPSGFEDDVVAIARKYASPKAQLTEDSLRNLYLRRPQDEGKGKPVVMLDAHSDEVGFMVQSIRPNGLLNIIPLGGWVNYTIPAHQVVIRTRSGKLQPGIIATKPPHYMSEQERKTSPDISAMSIDIGASSAEEVSHIFDIGIGAPVSPNTVCTYDEKTDILTGKAFDCRAGCACVIEAINRLMEETLEVLPVGALAAQEEVGTRGAKVTAQTVQPAVAIAFEGCPADDTFTETWAIQTALKKGPMLRHIDRGMITSPRFIRFALDVAAEIGIQTQEAVRSGGATNGAPIHLSGQGIPTIVIGIPVRYIHTHYGYASIQDIMQCVELGVAIVRRLTPDIIAGF